MSFDKRKELPSHISVPPFTRRKLNEIKRKAIRRGIWYTALNKMERACVDITIKVVDRVRSILLAKVLNLVVKKLSDVMENKVSRLMRRIGCELAMKISRIARAWGNTCAAFWARDLKFIRYLTIIKMNSVSLQP